VKAPEAEMFGRTLRRLRDERGLTQEKLARVADLTTISFRRSSGVTMVSLNTILKLAQGLKCSAADLLSDFTPARTRRALR